MIYQVQNACGEVHGRWLLPQDRQISAEGWARLLRAELVDILGVNGVVDVPLVSGTETVDRVVVDIDPFNPGANMERVHQAIGKIANNREVT